MKKPGTRILVRILLIALCCVLVGVLLVATLVKDLLGQIRRPTEESTLSSSEIQQILDEDTATGTGPTIHEEDIDFGSTPTKVTEDALVSILLVGQGSLPKTELRNADTVILCTINKETKTLTMTSFLRDMYVQIPGYDSHKMNTCYPIGGMKLLHECLEQNFGIEVDAGVAVDFTGFMKLIDMVGGVSIKLTAEEANYLNYYGNLGITGNQGWQTTAGENLLTGHQALAYSRIYTSGLDAERTERQRKVIAALLEKAKGMDFVDLYELIKEGLTMISTDMTDSQILTYAGEWIPLLTELKIVTQRIPVEGSYDICDVGHIGDCVVLDFDINRKALADTLEP